MNAHFDLRLVTDSGKTILEVCIDEFISGRHLELLAREYMLCLGYKNYEILDSEIWYDEVFEDYRGWMEVELNEY